MAVRTTWPYTDGEAPSESGQHVQLKNLAIWWLLQRGFSSGQIEEEKRVEGESRFGYIDIYASSGGVRVAVECELRDHSSHRLVDTGSQILWNRGGAVFIFKPDGIFRPVRRTVKGQGPSGLAERTITQLEFLRDLPRLDLRVFKQG